MSNSDTPRTDAAIFIAREGDCAVDPEEMRQLERYLAAADKRAYDAEAQRKIIWEAYQDLRERFAKIREMCNG